MSHHPDLTSADCAISVRDLEVRLPLGDRPYAELLPVLRGLDLTVPVGRVTALVGANGAGKTTVLRAVTGALAFSAGTIEVLGESVGPARARPPHTVASVPGISAYPRRWTAQHVARLRRRAIPGFDVARFEELLTALKVPVSREVHRLSRGQATQLGLAAALAQNPLLLILDEPFAHLDPLARTDLLDVLRDFMAREGRTLLFATHELDGMERFVDQIVLVSQGRAVLSEELESLREGFLVFEQEQGAADPGTAPPLIGATTTGTGTRALVALEDAVGLPPGASLRRPELSEIVTHLLRAARADATVLARSVR